MERDSLKHRDALTPRPRHIALGYCMLALNSLDWYVGCAYPARADVTILIDVVVSAITDLHINDSNLKRVSDNRNLQTTTTWPVYGNVLWIGSEG